jgi:hypothetical protein
LNASRSIEASNSIAADYPSATNASYRIKVVNCGWLLISQVAGFSFGMVRKLITARHGPATSERNKMKGRKKLQSICMPLMNIAHEETQASYY